MVGKNCACSFGKVSRNMIDNLEKDYMSFKIDIKKEFYDLKKTNETLYNHLSSRMPQWVTVIMTIGASTITGLVVWGVSQ